MAVPPPGPTPPWPARPWLWTLALFPNRFGNEVGSRAGSRYGRRHKKPPSPGWGEGISGLVGEGTLKGVGRPVQATNFSALPHLKGSVQSEQQGEGFPASVGVRTPETCLLPHYHQSPQAPCSWQRLRLLFLLLRSLVPSLQKPWLLPSGDSSPSRPAPAWPPSIPRFP